MKITINNREVDLTNVFAEIDAIDFVSSCKNKIKYGHQETAEKACVSMKRKKNLDLEPYQCRHCDGWHVGHAIED
jgi:hypothetical protein